MKMNLWNIGRKVFAIVLGAFWGYRANIAMERGITPIQYLISFIMVMVFLSVLAYFISKGKNTKDKEIIKKEVWKDVNWAIVAIVLAFILKLVFRFIFNG